MTRLLIELFKLGRIGMSPLTISVAIMGAMVLDIPLNIFTVFYLALLGLSAHFFGFALNDIIDQDIDKHVDYRQKSPLVKGSLSTNIAWGFTLIQIPFMILVYVLLIKGTLFGLYVLIGSILLSMVYNVWSKTGRLNRFIAEAALASSIGLLCLSASLSQGIQLNFVVFLFAAVLSLVLLLLNSISSGLKDLKTDYYSGARSFVISYGCKMLDQNQLFISKGIRIYSYVVQVFILSGIILLLYLLEHQWYLYIPACWLLFSSFRHIYLLLQKTTFSALKEFGPLMNGYFNYIAFTTLIITKMPLIWWLVVAFFISRPFSKRFRKDFWSFS